MWLFLILLQSLIVFAFSDHGILVHQANVAKLKCDALPFRSMYEDSKCYFAVSTQVPFERGTTLCHSVLQTAVMDTTTTSRPALRVLFLDPAKFHSELSYGQSKSVLCKYESPSSCDHDELKGVPGKCVRRLNTTMNFEEAKERCNSLDNSQLATINNDEENTAFANMIMDSGDAWILQPLFEQKSGAATTEKIQYLRWFMGESPPQCLAKSAITILATRNGSCSKLGYWQQTPVTSKSFAFCVRPSDGDFTPIEKRPVPQPTTTTTTRAPTTTTTNKLVDIARLMAVCDYKLATLYELCANCDRVIIETVGEGLRARCGSGKLLVFVPQKSIQPRFISKFMECNLTSAGWTYRGHYEGSSIKMGCAKDNDNGGHWLLNTYHGFLKIYMTPFAEDKETNGSFDGANEKVFLTSSDSANTFLSPHTGNTVTFLNQKSASVKWMPLKQPEGSWSFQASNGRYLGVHANKYTYTEGFIHNHERFWPQPL